MNIKYGLTFLISCLTVIACTSCDSSDQLTSINGEGTILVANEQEKLNYLKGRHPEINLVSAVHLLQTYQSNGWNVGNEDQLSWHSHYLDNIKINALMAEYYLSVNNLDKALEYCNRGEQLGANSKDAYLILSMIHSKLGNHNLAIDYINKVIMYNRNDAKMYEVKGDYYLTIADTLSAIHYFEVSLEKDNSHGGLVVKLAKLNSQIGQFKKAKYWIDQISDENFKSNVELQYAKISVLRNLGSELSADSLLHNLLDKGVQKAGIELLKIYKDRKQLDLMLDVANQVLKMDSVNTDANLSKAYIFNAKGYYSSAVQYYEVVLIKDPLNEEALEGLGKVNGKIAYLRKIKEKRESIPNFDFGTPRKKLTND